MSGGGAYALIMNLFKGYRNRGKPEWLTTNRMRQNPLILSLSKDRRLRTSHVNYWGNRQPHP